MKILQRVRLSTLLILMAFLALLVGLYAQKRRETQLQAELAFYRHPQVEVIVDALDQRLALNYGDEGTLEDLLKEIKLASTGRPKLASGIPLYVDPIGLQEAEVSMMSVVKKPARADKLTLGEHLRLALVPLGLGYGVKDGFLMITSKESLDDENGDEANVYLKYRDVLR